MVKCHRGLESLFNENHTLDPLWCSICNKTDIVKVTAEDVSAVQGQTAMDLQVKVPKNINTASCSMLLHMTVTAHLTALFHKRWGHSVVVLRVHVN